MARTAAFSFAIGLLFAWNWARLESPSTGVGPMLLMVVLGVLPVLLPTFRWRLAGAAVALLLAGSSALDVDRPWSIGTIAARAGRGFLDFYDVLVPFDAAAHPLMHGVVQLAVFLFTALAALAVAARRPVLAGLVVVAGAGWPATIMPGDDDLGRGAFVLAAVLALVAWLKPEGRRAPPQILVGISIVIVALVVSSSGAVAKSQFIGWQNWDFYNRPGKPVDVWYVWKSNYNGVDFPKERTRVFTVKAPARSTYWRATTLDVFSDDNWDENPYPLYVDVTGSPVRLTDDPLLPASAQNESDWDRADVTVDALRGVHLVGPSQPVQYDARDIEGVEYQRSGTALAFRPLGRGAEYTVWGYTPEPRPAKLAKSPATYPSQDLFGGGLFLSLPHGDFVPPFGSREHADWAERYFRDTPEGRRYEPLYREAQRIAGNAKNPYAAVVALEAWFRSAGGFVYDEHPPPAREAAPLVQFVTGTKRGYCQHFSGAMALMLRYLGIPARVAAGFTSGSYDKEREQWSVYDRNAHTWVEVWFDGFGWLPFDPTPGRGTLGGPYTTSSVRFDRSGADGVLFASALRRDLLRGTLGREGLVPNSPQSAAGAAEAGEGQRKGGRSSIAGLVVLAALVAALLFVLLKFGLRRWRYLTDDPRRIAAACRRDLVDFLRDQRIDVPPSIGTRELGHLLSSRGINGTGFADALGRARYGPLTRAREAAREAQRELKAVRRALRLAIPAGRRFRGLFSLRSLLAD